LPSAAILRRGFKADADVASCFRLDFSPISVAATAQTACASRCAPTWAGSSVYVGLCPWWPRSQHPGGDPTRGLPGVPPGGGGFFFRRERGLAPLPPTNVGRQEMRGCGRHFPARKREDTRQFGDLPGFQTCLLKDWRCPHLQRASGWAAPVNTGPAVAGHLCPWLLRTPKRFVMQAGSLPPGRKLK